MPHLDDSTATLGSDDEIVLWMPEATLMRRRSLNSILSHVARVKAVQDRTYRTA